jgi:hypothetical protein
MEEEKDAMNQNVIQVQEAKAINVSCMEVETDVLRLIVNQVLLIIKQINARNMEEEKDVMN